MGVPLETETALSVRYVVSLDDADLGAFTTCEGLGCEVVLEAREEGGNNGMVWQLPTRLKYPNVKLTRPLGKDTAKVTALFTKMTTGYTFSTGTIEAMLGNGTKLATWGLLNVVPVKWSGPSFTPDQPKVIVEILEIAHHGFLPAGSN